MADQNITYGVIIKGLILLITCIISTGYGNAATAGLNTTVSKEPFRRGGGGGGGGGRFTTRRTNLRRGPAAFPFTCSGVDLKVLSDCCELPAGDFFTPLQLVSCNGMRTDPALFQWVRDYVENRMMDPNNKNNIDYNSPANVRTLAPPACLLECLFRNNSLLQPDGRIQYSALKQFLMIHAPDDWSKPLSSIVDSCERAVSGLSRTRISWPNIKSIECTLEPIVTLQCVRRYLPANCPGGIRRDMPRCSKTLDTLSECLGGKQRLMTNATNRNRRPPGMGVGSWSGGGYDTSNTQEPRFDSMHVVACVRKYIPKECPNGGGSTDFAVFSCQPDRDAFEMCLKSAMITNYEPPLSRRTRPPMTIQIIAPTPPMGMGMGRGGGGTTKKLMRAPPVRPLQSPPTTDDPVENAPGEPGGAADNNDEYDDSYSSYY